MAEEEFGEKILNDSLTLGLLITSFFFLLLGIFNRFNISFGNNFLTQAISLFSVTVWVILALAVFCSSILAYFKKYKLMALVLLIALIGITAMIRTSNINDLKDITTNTWTLGPDLDPFLYLRNAEEIVKGTLQNPDMMRAAPLGYENYAYKNLMPWAIVLIYKIVSIFTPITLTYAAIITPVIFFCISILGFFLFVYNLSLFKFSKKKSLVVALLASVLYSISPSMVGRTVAGVPEIESLGMIWFWFAFLSYALAWKKDKINLKITFAILAGIFTGLMSYTWGGYRYIYMVISLTTLILFLFQKQEKENFIIFSSWIIPALILEFSRTGNLFDMLTRVSDTGFAFVVLLFLITNWIISKQKVNKIFEKINLPTNVMSILLVILLALIFIFLVNRELLFSLISRLVEGFLYPWGRDRIGLTVAENRAPYFSEVLGEFGNLAWVFLSGVIFLFYQAVKCFKRPKENEFEKWIFIAIAVFSLVIFFYIGNVLVGPNYQQLKDQIDFLVLIPLFLSLVGGIYFFAKRNISLNLNFSFLFFVSTLIFSRISPQSTTLNGENTFSEIIYFSGLLFFLTIVCLNYIRAYKKRDEHIINCFKEINFFYALILVFSFWAIISMRGAVRLFFIIPPMLIIASSFIFAELYEYKNSFNKKLIWAAFIILILVFVQISASYTLQTQYTTKGMIPSGYNQQWQSAMKWVRENTPKESIFIHWWDYGYWVQTIGERATVVDGGHPWGFWDHLVGRYILTAPAPEIALSMMKTDNVSYLLIDSSDIGKYPAFSKIGSDKGGEDRYSQIPIFSVDPAQTRETSNKTMRVYTGGGIVDEDIIYTPEEENSTEIFLPKGSSYVIFIIYDIVKKGNESTMEQPKAIFFYNNQQISIPVRYAYYQGKKFDYKKGLNATISFVPKVSSAPNNQVQSDEIGAAIYLSPKVSKGLLGQLYLLDSNAGRYSEFELAHSEPDKYIAYLESMGLKLGEFAYISGNLRGPIKIWKITPDENISVNKEFLRTSGEYAEFDDLHFVNE